MQIQINKGTVEIDVLLSKIDPENRKIDFYDEITIREVRTIEDIEKLIQFLTRVKDKGISFVTMKS